MSNVDHKPRTDDQATGLKVTAKLKKRRYEPDLSTVEAAKCLKETKGEPG